MKEYRYPRETLESMFQRVKEDAATCNITPRAALYSMGWSQTEILEVRIFAENEHGANFN